MKIKLNREKLHDLLASFYEIAGIRIVIFDPEMNEIMAYPADKCSFCRTLRAHNETNARCTESDHAGVKALEAGGEDIHIYHCHAGLVEAITPLRRGGSLFGYAMFGQITDIKSKDELAKAVNALARRYSLELLPDGLKYRSQRQIVAAARILAICCEYILMKEMIEPEHDPAIDAVKHHIAEHLGEPISVDELARISGYGRTKLYRRFSLECGIGIAEYIRRERLEAARRKLRLGGLSVAEVASAVGIPDYNYFGRLYKRAFGISPGKERLGT